MPPPMLNFRSNIATLLPAFARKYDATRPAGPPAATASAGATMAFQAAALNPAGFRKKSNRDYMTYATVLFLEQYLLR